MFSMSNVRENSKGMMWLLLFFFVASMTVGGLVGGANILSTIQGFFGKIDTGTNVLRTAVFTKPSRKSSFGPTKKKCLFFEENSI